jgi:PilZ domain
MSFEPIADRRQYLRRIPEAKELLSQVRLRGGRELEVKNISAGGALLEGESRLLPGTHVDLHVMTRQGRVVVRARILRASVVRLTADSVGYRIALLFGATVDTAAPRSPGQVVGDRNPSSST